MRFRPWKALRFGTCPALWHRPLRRELPLAADNHHVLLLNITGDQSFDTAFGGGGRLEIWIRDTDLRAARFGSIVSFIRST
ncbi:MAG: DUF1963 domain-containing protein [Cryobacterium sp.]